MIRDGEKRNARLSDTGLRSGRRLRGLMGNPSKLIEILSRKSAAGSVGDVNLPAQLFEFACFVDSNAGTYADRRDVLIGFPSVNGERHCLGARLRTACLI